MGVSGRACPGGRVRAGGRVWAGVSGRAGGHVRAGVSGRACPGGRVCRLERILIFSWEGLQSEIMSFTFFHYS